MLPSLPFSRFDPQFRGSLCLTSPRRSSILNLFARRLTIPPRRSLLSYKKCASDFFRSLSISFYLHSHIPLSVRTQTHHSPQSTYRAAFTAAFFVLIPLLGPPGTLSSEWLGFLRDFPSRIPQSQRDSIVSIPWPEPCVSVPDVSSSLLQPPGPSRPSRPPKSYGFRRRSRSLDGIPSLISPTPTTAPPVPLASNGEPGAPPPPTGLPRCERDAWVLLLALAYAAFPLSRAALKMRKLPMAVKLQMIAWLPPGV